MIEIKKIPLENLHNTRDLGGFPSNSGKKIKPCKLIRSGELYSMSKQDKNTLLNKYKLKTILDFRSSTEAAERPDPELNGVSYIHHPILNEAALGITRENDRDKEQNKSILDAVLSSMSGSENGARDYMASLYYSLITQEYSKSQYRKFFKFLLSQKEGSILWHCTAGKDRAGTAAVLLLSALDIPRELIVEDYLKVNAFTHTQIEEKVMMVKQKTSDEQIADKIRSLFSADEAYIQSIFNTVEKEYGGMNDYLHKEMKLSDEDFSALNSLYLI